MGSEFLPETTESIDNRRKPSIPWLSVAVFLLSMHALWINYQIRQVNGSMLAITGIMGDMLGAMIGK